MAAALPDRGASAHPQSQAWDDPQVPLHQERCSLHRYEPQNTPAAKRPKNPSGLLPGSVLDKNNPSKTEVQSQGTLDVCVCFFDYAMPAFTCTVCTSCSNMIFFHDGMTLRLPLIWENLERAGTSLGKRNIWKSICVCRISTFFSTPETLTLWNPGD